MVEGRRTMNVRKATMGAIRKTTLAGLAAALIALLLPATSALGVAVPGFTKFEVTPDTTVAGGHPNIEFNMGLNIDEPGACTNNECTLIRRFEIHWPEGFIGNPHVTPKCTLVDFSQGACPIESQVGIVAGAAPEFLRAIQPLYNMETGPEEAGKLGFQLPLVFSPIFLDLTSRTDSDYGLEARSSVQTRLIQLPEYQTQLWGVPSSPKNTPLRFVTPLTGFGACLEFAGSPTLGCPSAVNFNSPTYAKSNSPELPFLQNPTTCGIPLIFSADAEFYEGTVEHAETAWPPTTECEQGTFDPSLTGSTTTPQTDSASGLDTNLLVPQTQSPLTPAPSELRTSRVKLPEGFTINPNAADGKVACPESLSSIGTLLAAQCPEFSKIGTVILDVAALPGPIPGAMYIAEPLPNEPYRVLLAADGFATHVKLLGSVRPDPQTGRVSIVFEDLPQSPLQEFSIHIFGSERGLFATPTRCGTFPLESEFVPWNSVLPTKTSLSSITLSSGPGGSPCPGPQRPLNPTMEAGSENGTAGTHSPFSFELTRSDGNQNLTAVDVSTPPGLLATLKEIPYCPESAIATLTSGDYDGRAEQVSPACGAASRVGSVVTGVGAGNHPLYSPGSVFLAGPYKGAPLSFVFSVPAVSGPYDLGTVGVRVAIHVDPVTARVTAASDPLPQILDGIPLRIRSVKVALNRPNFTLNPTNCDPLAVSSTVSGAEGGSASVGDHFQVSNCASLGFGPKLRLRLTGGMKRRGHPAIHATFTTGSGEANSKAISVTLPKGELLDNAHITTVCTRVQFAAASCPVGSLLGSAEVSTPLLDQPLKGNVYLRTSSNKLPDLVLDLKGQIDVTLAGRVDSVNGRLRTTFENLPDAPVSRVSLDLLGGSKGLLINSEPLCVGKKKALVRMTGQNNARLTRRFNLQTSCGGKRAKKQTKRSSR